MTLTDTAMAAARRTPQPKTVLMCRPDFFTVSYRINPWMHPEDPTSTATAVEQWEVLYQTYLDLGMPIQVQSGSRGVIVAESAAPTPLTLEEWKEVVRIEGPRVKQIGGWYMEMRDDPKGYFVAVRATLRPMPSGTFVLLDYELDNREIRAMGVRPSRHAPRSAHGVLSEATAHPPLSHPHLLPPPWRHPSPHRRPPAYRGATSS